MIRHNQKQTTKHTQASLLKQEIELVKRDILLFEERMTGKTNFFDEDIQDLKGRILVMEKGISQLISA